MSLEVSDSEDLYSEVMMYEYERAGVIEKKPALKLPAKNGTVSQYKQSAVIHNLNPKQEDDAIVEKTKFLSRIAANYKSSCFIDAFELLWNAVLPFVSLEGLGESGNIYDNILITSNRK